jgi:hypothetical protein
MRLSAIPAVLALAVSSIAAHAVSISVTVVSPFAISVGDPADNDMLSLSAASANVAVGGVYSQPGIFHDGYVYTEPLDPFTFQDTFTVNGITETLTFSGSDAVTDSFDTLTIDPLGDVAFGTITLDFAGVTALNYSVDGDVPITLNASVTPEPSSFALLGTGVLSLAGAVRRRFKR